MENNFKNIDLLVMMNDLQQFAQPSTTAVNIPTQQGDFFKNQPKLANGVGSPTDMLGGLSEEELLEIVMSVSPVGGSIRGGKAVKSTLDSMLKKYFGGVKGKGYGTTLDDFASQIKFKNKMSSARMKNQQVLDKHGIKDPDKKGMVDTISALLSNYFSKN